MLLKVWERIWRPGLPAYCLIALYAAGVHSVSTVANRFGNRIFAPGTLYGGYTPGRIRVWS